MFIDNKGKDNLFFYALPPIITFCKTYNCFMKYCKKIEVYFEKFLEQIQKLAQVIDKYRLV